MNVHRFLFRTLLGRRLPRTSGTVEITGISSSVTIRRDTYSIPYIEAKGDEDAWYGVGFCQGQDRAFQIDSMARVARGTLSELVGKPGLPVDRLSRNRCHWRTAGYALRRSVAATGPPSHQGDFAG